MPPQDNNLTKWGISWFRTRVNGKRGRKRAGRMLRGLRMYRWVILQMTVPFRIFFTRLPHYFGDRKRDPNSANYPSSLVEEWSATSVRNPDSKYYSKINSKPKTLENVYDPVKPYTTIKPRWIFRPVRERGSEMALSVVSRSRR